MTEQQDHPQRTIYAPCVGQTPATSPLLDFADEGDQRCVTNRGVRRAIGHQGKQTLEAPHFNLPDSAEEKTAERGSLRWAIFAQSEGRPFHLPLWPTISDAVCSSAART